VTSSNPSPGGVCTGLGISPTKITKIIGVVKAYTTRVGEGPLPTELKAEEGDNLRKLGAEFGATTGRPRRCGWFDANVVRRSVQIAGVSEIALTKLDVLDSLANISICTHYELKGEKTDLFPFGIDSQNDYKPVYEEVAGWQSPIDQIKDYDALPDNARLYIERLSQLLNVEIKTISVGAERGKLIRKESRFFHD
jgi:adenylosuccinate synthase